MKKQYSMAMMLFCAVLVCVGLGASNSYGAVTDTLTIVKGADTLRLALPDVGLYGMDGGVMLGDSAFGMRMGADGVEELDSLSHASSDMIYISIDSVDSSQSFSYEIGEGGGSDTLRSHRIEMVSIDTNQGNVKVITRDAKGFKILDGTKVYRLQSRDRGSRGKLKRMSLSQASSSAEGNGEQTTIDDVFDEMQDWLVTKHNRPRKKFRGHWAGIEWGFNWLLNAQWGLDMRGEESPYQIRKGRSYKFALNPLQFSTGLGTNRFGVVTGIGFDFKRYDFTGHGMVSQLAHRTAMEDAIVDGSIPILHSRLWSYHFTVPLLFEFQNRNSKFWRRYYISFGAIGSVLLSENYKLTTRDGRSLSYNQPFNLADLQVAPTLRVGFGLLRLFVNAYPMGLFDRSSSAPKLIPFEVGFALLHF